MPNWKKVIVSGSSAHLNQVTASSGIQLADDAILNIGDGNDLQLYHDGSNSYIKDNGTGNIFYRGGTQTFQNAAGSKTMATFNAANSVDLNFNDNTKFQTTNTGVSVTGDVLASGNVSGSSTSTGSFAHLEVVERIGVNKTSPASLIHVAASTTDDDAGITLSSAHPYNWSLGLDAGDGHYFKITNADTPGGGTDYFSMGGGNIITSQNLTVQGNFYVANRIIHEGENDVSIEFTSNQIDFQANDNSMLYTPMHLSGSSPAGVHFTGSFGLVNISQEITGSSTSTATFGNYGGNISGSATSTGSFGTIKVGGHHIYGDGDGIGINQSNPAGEFHLKSTGANHTDLIIDTAAADKVSGLYYYEAGTAKSAILHYGEASGNGGAGDGGLQFLAGGISVMSNTRMVIKSDGDVGIGTFDPSKKLTVAGDISASGDFLGSSTSTGSLGSLIVDGASIDFSNVPTSDPNVAGRVWRDGTDLKISTG